MELLVETDGEKQLAQDKEIEGGELGIRGTATILECQTFLYSHLIIVAQTSCRTRTPGQVACAATNDLRFLCHRQIVGNE